jgi:hypothetical protein
MMTVMCKDVSLFLHMQAQQTSESTHKGRVLQFSYVRSAFSLCLLTAD